MSKVDPPPANAYSPTVFVTGDQITSHYGVATVSLLPAAEQTKYNNYAALSNKQTETIIYRYVDTIPLSISDEARTYAEGLALYYAIYLKQTDDGAQNVQNIKEIWTDYKDQLIEVLKSQPKSATTRTVVSNGYKDTVTPYSQTGGGVVDIL